MENDDISKESYVHDSDCFQNYKRLKEIEKYQIKDHFKHSLLYEHSKALERYAMENHHLKSQLEELIKDRDKYKTWYDEECATNKTLGRNLVQFRKFL